MGSIESVPRIVKPMLPNNGSNTYRGASVGTARDNATLPYRNACPPRRPPIPSFQSLWKTLQRWWWTR